MTSTGSTRGDFDRTVLDRAKDVARSQVWDALVREQAAQLNVHGKIPAFLGADVAADRLAALPVWERARVVKAVPDRAQLPVRARALAEGKLVYMAVPKLATAQPFRLLDPLHLTVSPDHAAAHETAMRVGQPVGVEEMRPVDLVVCGSVAVNRHGARLGKGAGYADLEVALLVEAGLLTDATTIVTTVHPLQILDQDLPESRHDFRVDVIVTPDEVITCTPPRRPTGLYWDDLPTQKINAIPILQKLAEVRRESSTSQNS
jgi:5-formyltetrahydrofolate cyclo-ligase